MVSREAIERRRQRAAHAWRGQPGALDNAAVVIGAGSPIGIPGGQDQTFDFIPHPNYRWLTGRADVGAVAVFDPSAPEGEGWIEFVPAVSEAERVWEGREPHDIPDAKPIGEFAGWLGRQQGKRLASIGSPVSGVGANAEASAALGDLFQHARRPKDAYEIELVRRAIGATAQGFGLLPELIRPGVSERRVQIELEAAMRRAGAEGFGYGTLVGSGPNASVLHFAPSERVVRENELVLVDAGGAIGGYTADVTRTYGSTPLVGERRALYDAVLHAEIRAVERCRVGITWRDMHTRAAIDLAEGLIAMGVFRGRVEAIVEREAIALFFPHGIGHMVGLGVRDAGGRRPGAAPGGTCCGVNLRVDLPLEAGYLMTVEPGLYFIRALLDDPARRERFADCVNWQRVDQLLDKAGGGAAAIGGVRIEDNILVSESGPVNLTAAIAK